MEQKYILQYGSLAGWPYKIAKKLREKGVCSENVILYDRDVFDLKRKLPFDRALCKYSDSIIKKMKSIFSYINSVPEECNFIHYHSSNIFFRELHFLYEGRFFSKKKIPMLISFGGGDARLLSVANRKNKYFYKKNSFIKEFVVRARYFSWGKYIKYCATDPEMAEYAAPYFEKVYTFRQPVDLGEISCKFPDPDNIKPIVLHIPTEPYVKGTEYVVEAVERLKNEGVDFEFRLLRQLTQVEVYSEIQSCDIYIDELRCGSHGVTAVETMAAGKPTITYIRDDLVAKYPKDLPLVNANIENVYQILKDLILNPRLRNEIGKSSRAYVEKYHDLDVVTSELIEVYNEIRNFQKNN